MDITDQSVDQAKQPEPARQRGLLASSLAVLLAVSGGISLLLSGALLINLTVDTRIASDLQRTEPFELVLALLFSVLLFVISGMLLVRSRCRRSFLQAAVLTVTVLLALIAGEAVLRQKVPGWPARGLHGVAPEVWAAAVQLQGSGSEQWNSWGQRDRARTLHPKPGVPRIAFIGDSFLEEGADLPVSLATESLISGPAVEIINLGVSATGPDEYYDRLRGIAQPLGVSYCYLFLFAGNDFVSPARTLPTWWNVVSVEPRPSLFSTLGLAGWNHALTNRYRPVNVAWLQGSQLAQEERHRAQMLAQASDDQIRAMLLGASGFQSQAYDRLDKILHEPGIERFFEILRNPDEDKFRSYYLASGLSAAGDPDWKWEANSEAIAWEWTERAVQFCQRFQIGLTVVVIPEAFQVDDRMRDQWRPLADLRQATAPCRVAATNYVQRARAAQVDIVDLHEHLQGVPGTYLNLDGHWSQSGVNTVAQRLAKHWQSRRPKAGDPHE